MREVSDHTMERELAVVAALRHAGEAAGPRSDELERMRSRVMAGAAPADPDTTTTSERITPLPTQRTARHAKRRPVAAEARGRLLVAAAAALCVLMSLSGMSLLLSRDAMPGDALYAVKRSTESAELGLTFGEEPKAFKHLEFAASRVNEIQVMATQDDGSGSSGTSPFIATLDDFESDTKAATRLLTELAVQGEFGLLSSLIGWTTQQEQALETVRATLPAEASDRVAGTLRLLDRVQQRAVALQSRAGCQNVTSGTSDELGPIPAEDSCVPAPLDEASSAVPIPEPTESAPPASPGDAAVPDRQAGDEQTTPTDQQEPSERPELRDVVPLPDKQEWEDWKDREDRPLRPGEDTAPSDPPSPFVLPLPLLPDITVGPQPDGPAP